MLVYSFIYQTAKFTPIHYFTKLSVLTKESAASTSVFLLNKTLKTLKQKGLQNIEVHQQTASKAL